MKAASESWARSRSGGGSTRGFTRDEAETLRKGIENATLALFMLAPMEDLQHPAWDAHAEWKRKTARLADRLRNYDPDEDDDDDED